MNINPFFKAVLILCVVFATGNTFAFEALSKKVPAPKDNPTTPAKIELGRLLYFDKRLSIDNSIFSCL